MHIHCISCANICVHRHTHVHVHCLMHILSTWWCILCVSLHAVDEVHGHVHSTIMYAHAWLCRQLVPEQCLPLIKMVCTQFIGTHIFMYTVKSHVMQMLTVMAMYIKQSCDACNSIRDWQTYCLESSRWILCFVSVKFVRKRMERYIQ